jgi:hypothetical protein
MPNDKTPPASPTQPTPDGDLPPAVDFNTITQWAQKRFKLDDEDETPGGEQILTDDHFDD